MNLDPEVRLLLLQAELADIFEQLDEAIRGCYHYGPPLRYKWNGGSTVTLCGLCGASIR